MVQKKVVDDYYANISSDDNKIENKNTPVKIKVKAKKKVVVVKKDISEIKKDTSKINDKEVFIDGEKKNQGKNILEKNPRKIVQKISVVKKDDIEKRTPIQRERKSPITIVRRGDKPVNSWIKDRNSNKVEKTYKTNSTIWQKTQSKTEEESKKSKLWFQGKKTRWRFRFVEEKEVTFIRSNKLLKKKKEEKKIEDIKQNLIERKWETVIVWDFLTLKELSEKIWVILPTLMAEFMKNWMMVNINSKIDFDSASIVAEAFEVKLERDSSAWAKVEDLLSWNLTTLLAEDDSSKLKKRCPIVSIMWHVDHWKTSLLDYIRKSKVTSSEAGWITQSIWAYQVELESWKITFLDTPGHEAFTIMRARWAKSTDIAILVVAADEWVKPQTIESINHAKEAGIPVIVAINKMDKEWANPDHVKWQLAENWLTAEDWGGDTPMIPVSAHSGFWVEELLDMILLVSEMKELKANPDRNAIATVIESHLNLKLWPVATVLINTWTINKQDNIVCNDAYWKVKILKNFISKNIVKAIPWEPVLIVWLDKVVEWWDILQVVNNPEIARQKSLEYKEILLKKKKAWASSLDVLMSKIKAWNLKQLKIIIKADTNWSLEAIKWSLVKLSTPETTVSIIHSWVWSITEWDILMWQWSEAILVWFNVWVLPTAKWTLGTAWVEFISSDIIYHITERIEKIVTWMLDPKEVETILCRAKVAWIFYTSKEFMVVWLKIVEEEKIENNTLVRVIRNKKIVGKGKIKSLKSWTLEVKQLEWPIECWVKFEWKIVIEMWDEFEVYKIEIQK